MSEVTWRPARLILLSLVACLFALPALTQLRPRMDVPVLAGGGGSSACPGRGEVVGLDPNGDGFLSVRSGPGGRPYSEVDRVHNGQPVHICDESGPWLAAVYPRAGQGPEACNVAHAWTTRQPYTGPCAYGWMHGRYVRRSAGLAGPNRAPPERVPLPPPPSPPAFGGEKAN